MADQVSNALTLVMPIRSQADYEQLRTMIEGLQNKPADQNPIHLALTSIGNVHFARFVFLGTTQLAVITTYDDGFVPYIQSFVDKIGSIFDQLLAHIQGAPPLPVREHVAEFVDFVERHDVPCVGELYSAYPEHRVQDILTMINRTAQ